MTAKITDAAGRSHIVTVDTDGGPGSVALPVASPGASYEVTIGGPGLAEVDRRHRFEAPADPPGEVLCRIATVNDVHLGEDRFGFFKTIRERPAPEVVSSQRCLATALDTIERFDADVLVVKGDLVDEGTAEEWALARAMLGAHPTPVELMLGNHEARSSRGLDPLHPDAAGEMGIDDPVRVRDLPGIRLVMADTPLGRSNRRGIDHLADQILDAAASSPTPVMVLLHHHLQRHRLPTFLPGGIPGDQARDFLDRLAACRPDAMVVSGHTHRNRRRHHGAIPVIEVGSTKDYPGVWAGYTVHEGGVRQTSYRIDAPDCLRWTERTRWAALGLWGRWSPGHLHDRSFSHRWPTPSP